MVRKKDPFWEYVEPLDGRFICKFCEKNFAGGVPRIKSHLSGIKGRDIEICSKVPDDVQAKAYLAIGGSNKKLKSKEGPIDLEEHVGGCSVHKSLQQQTVPEIFKKKNKEEVDKKLANFFVLNNIPFNVVQSQSFKEFLKDIMEYGPSYKIPSYSVLRTKLIPNARNDIEQYIAEVKKTWATSGCAIMSDMWSDLKHRSFINIIAYSPRGAVFLNSFEVSKDKKTGTYLRDILNSVVEDIGPQHVVQFITDNASNFESAGNMLIGKYRHLYKTHCAAHGIQLLLKDIHGQIEWIRTVIDDAKIIVEYMYRHTIVLALMREFTKSRELKHPCTTRFASNFKMLESILSVENELRSFVASVEWRGLEYSKRAKAKKVEHIIQNSEFWKQGNDVFHALEPLVRVLRLVDGEGSTAGYLYEAMKRAKEAIRNNCRDNSSRYMRIWTLFESRRVENIIHPIYAAAAFLNPAFMRKENFTEDKKMKTGITYMLENMVSPEERAMFMKELQIYRLKPSSLFTTTALTMLETSHPRVWWDFCGDSLPTVRKYAIRILSQPCSSSACERNWSAWEAAQTKKRNRLAPEMLKSLVFIRMNSMMKEKFELLEARDIQPISLDNLDDLPDYVDPPRDEDDTDADVDPIEDDSTLFDEEEYMLS